MKKLITILTIISLFVLVQTAASTELCVEPTITNGLYELNDNGTITSHGFVEYVDTDGTWHCIKDVADLTEGDHTFLVRSIDVSGIEGNWSLPFDARKPGASTKWKIRK